MSLEENLMHLVAAVDRLTAAIKADGWTTEAPVKPQAPVVISGTVQGTEIGSTAPQNSTQTTSHSEKKSSPSTGTTKSSEAAASAPSASGESTGAAPDTLDYDKDVFPIATKAVGLGHRDKVVGLIQSYKAGAKTLKEAITPAQYAEVISQLKGMME